MTNEPETNDGRADKTVANAEKSAGAKTAQHAKQSTPRHASADRWLPMPSEDKPHVGLMAAVFLAALVVAVVGFFASASMTGEDEDAAVVAADAADASQQSQPAEQPEGQQEPAEQQPEPVEQPPAPVDPQADLQQHVYFDNRQEGVNYPDANSLMWRDADFAVDSARREWNDGMSDRKVVYLTIDDGPSERTQEVLDILDRYNVKATFFVTGHEPDYYGMIAEAYRRGHTIGLHSMTHSYATVYESTDAFFADLDEIGQVVRDQIGYVPCFIRFPGGSSNTVSAEYTEGIMTDLTQQVQDRGYQYYDWNSDTGDGAGYSAEDMIGQVCVEPTSSNIFMLCHDSKTKTDTVEALPTIIEYFQGLGYSFEALDRGTWTCHHGVFN